MFSILQIFHFLLFFYCFIPHILKWPDWSQQQRRESQHWWGRAGISGTGILPANKIACLSQRTLGIHMPYTIYYFNNYIMLNLLFHCPTAGLLTLYRSDCLPCDREQLHQAWSDQQQSGMRTPGRWIVGLEGSAVEQHQTRIGNVSVWAPELQQEPGWGGATRTALWTQLQRLTCRLDGRNVYISITTEERK